MVKWYASNKTACVSVLRVIVICHPWWAHSCKWRRCGPYILTVNRTSFNSFYINNNIDILLPVLLISLYVFYNHFVQIENQDSGQGGSSHSHLHFPSKRSSAACLRSKTSFIFAWAFPHFYDTLEFYSNIKMINKRNSFISYKPINFMVRFGEDPIKVTKNQCASLGRLRELNVISWIGLQGKWNCEDFF